MKTQNMMHSEAAKKEFKFTFKTKSTVSTLSVPLPIPLPLSAREFVGRLMCAHDLPCYVEEELLQELQQFVTEETAKFQNENASNTLKSLEGAAHDKLGNIADQWSKSYTQECTGYTQEKKVAESQEFTELYHKLIHSQTLEVLFHLEHTYSVAVQDIVVQRDNAIQKLQLKQSQEMERAVQNLDITHDDQHVNMLAARHFENMQRESQQWEMELKNLQEAQREEFKQYIYQLSNDTNSGQEGLVSQRIRAMSDSLPVQATEEIVEEPAMNESFTIHLGAQLKTSHNLRLMSMDVLDLCRHKPIRARGRLMPQPQRLQSAMSLYSNSLSALVLMVDDRVNSYTGIKKEFANICQQSTDFHFPDMDTQLRVIQQDAQKANAVRKQRKMEKGSADSTTSEGSSGSDNGEMSSNLQTGDFYMTRHSNLSQVHLVFHLVSDDSIRDVEARNRHPVILALKNILKIAVQFDIYTITLPLFLVYEMYEEMTIAWCTRRAELVFKCVKGFMMEMPTSSGGSDGGETRTIQFVVPKGISEELFSTLSTMLPQIFQQSRSLDLTQR